MPTGSPGSGRWRRPLEIQLNRLHARDVDEGELVRTAERLASSYPELSGCRLVVEPAHTTEGGDTYRVAMDLAFPPGRLHVELAPGAVPSRQNFTALLCEALERGRRAEAVHHWAHPQQ